MTGPSSGVLSHIAGSRVTWGCGEQDGLVGQVVTSAAKARYHGPPHRWDVPGTDNPQSQDSLEEAGRHRWKQGSPAKTRGCYTPLKREELCCKPADAADGAPRVWPRVNGSSPQALPCDPRREQRRGAAGTWPPVRVGSGACALAADFTCGSGTFYPVYLLGSETVLCSASRDTSEAALHAW